MIHILENRQYTGCTVNFISTSVSYKVHKLDQSKKRVADIDRVISRLYEDIIIGKLSDERFMKMSTSYEQEQKNLELTIKKFQKLMDDIRENPQKYKLSA